MSTYVDKELMSTYVDMAAMSSYVDSMSKRIRSARDLGATIRGRRIELRLSQDRLASAVAVSRQWLSAVETGKPTAEIGLVLRVLDELQLDLVPEPRTAEAVKTVDLDDVLADHQRQ